MLKDMLLSSVQSVQHLASMLKNFQIFPYQSALLHWPRVQGCELSEIPVNPPSKKSNTAHNPRERGLLYEYAVL
jgi:hypothetical protein